MWCGYTDALKLYLNIIATEWVSRGYKNNMELYTLPAEVVQPWWMGEPDFHFSHQASLCRKDPEYYSVKLTPPEHYHKKGYVWPKTVDDVHIIKFAAVFQSASNSRKEKKTSYGRI